MGIGPPDYGIDFGIGLSALIPPPAFSFLQAGDFGFGLSTFDPLASFG
jgi:hypothetical protein